MTKVAVITDSTCSMPRDLIQQYDIKVAPQVVIWGGESLLDEIDMTAEQFYERLTSSDEFPTTSQATIGSFKEIFEPLVAAGQPIVAICVSDKLSGTYQSAMQAKDLFPDAPIHVVNSETVAMALGFQVLAAARKAQAGGSAEEVVAASEQEKKRSGVILMLDTLEFLHRGGRIGNAQRLLGAALNLKPILTVEEGRVEPLDRVRTRSKATARLLELVEERVAGQRPLKVAIHHTGAIEHAQDLRRQIEEKFTPDEVFFSIITPAVGAHAGPGAVAVAYAAGG